MPPLPHPPGPCHLSPHPLATSLLTSMFGGLLLIAAAFISVTPVPAVEIIVILPASPFQKCLLSIQSMSPATSSLPTEEPAPCTPCEQHPARTHANMSPAPRQAKNWDQDHGGHQPQGFCSACPCKLPRRNPLVAVCVPVGSLSPLAMGSMSCQRCSTSPRRPTFSLGCFFPTTAALTQHSNCPGPCMRGGQHGAGLVLSPVTQPGSVELRHHQLSVVEGTRGQAQDNTRASLLHKLVP